MKDARGHFPNGSHVTPPFPKWIKMVPGETGYPDPPCANTSSLRSGQRVLKPPEDKANCSDIKACQISTGLDLSSQPDLNYCSRLVFHLFLH